MLTRLRDRASIARTVTVNGKDINFAARQDTSTVHYLHGAVLNVLSVFCFVTFLVFTFWALRHQRRGVTRVDTCGVARNFRHGVRQSVAFLSVHSRSAALPSRPYNQKTS